MVSFVKEKTNKGKAKDIITYMTVPFNNNNNNNNDNNNKQVWNEMDYMLKLPAAV